MKNTRFIANYQAELIKSSRVCSSMLLHLYGKRRRFDYRTQVSVLRQCLIHEMGIKIKTADLVQMLKRLEEKQQLVLRTTGTNGKLTIIWRNNIKEKYLQLSPADRDYRDAICIQMRNA